MLTQFEDYLTIENIYLWINIGVLPFWFMLIVVPNSRVTLIFVNSIIAPLVLASAYVYVIYLAILSEEPLLDLIKIYSSLDALYTIFATDNFLLIFWIHFVSLNLFLGSWVSRDSIKHSISRKLVFIPLILIYFTGPIGLIFYWFIRIFYAKKIGIHD